MSQPWQGTVAVVVVVDDAIPHGHGSSGDEARRTEDQAVQLRGTLIRRDDTTSLFVFTTAPRAVEFGVGLHARRPAGLRIGIHVGELTHRDGEAFGVPLRVAQELAEIAQPGETLVSPVVHDIVRGSDQFTLSPVAGRGPVRAHAVTATTPHDVPIGATVPLPRLVTQLHDAVARSRLTLVVGGAGSGKSTLVEAITDRYPTVWLSIPTGGLRPATFARSVVDGLRSRVPGVPTVLATLAGGLEADDDRDQQSRAETFASAITDSLADLIPRGLMLVVDGADRLAASPVCVGLLEALARSAPPSLHLVLAARRDPGLRTSRLGAAGLAATISDAELRLTDEELATVIGARLGLDPTHAEVQRLVPVGNGQPETAVLAAACARRGLSPTAATAGGLARELLGRLSDADRSLLEALAALSTAGPDLLRRVSGVPAAQRLPSLVGDGLVRTGPPGLVEIGAAASLAVDLPADTRRRLCLSAGRELQRAGDAAGALRVLYSIGAREESVDILREEGRHLLLEGRWPLVLDALGELAAYPPDPEAPVSREVRDVLPTGDLAGMIGEAWRLAGDRDRALSWFMHASADSTDVPSWLAWRMGILLHFGGELDRARELYRAATDGDPADRALVHAWAAAAAWIQSDVDSCRLDTAAAERLARAAGDDRALAAAHTVKAMLAAVEGDRIANDQHYLRALEHAERAGDLLQIVRIRTNRGSRLLEEGEHVDALAELELALATTDLMAMLPLHGMALSNRGQVLRRLGRLEEATADLVASRVVLERSGSRWVGYALANLGELYQVRGDRAAARAAFDEALMQCEPVGDTQGMIPALAGLATLTLPDDPGRARELAEAACAHPGALEHSLALATLAQVALAQGDDADAVAANDVGIRLAEERRDRPALATHLEIRSRMATTPDGARDDLIRARSLWATMECPLEAARVDVALAVLDPATHREHGDRAVTTLRSHGARAWAEDAVRRLTATGTQPGAPVRVRVLGGFRVEREGAVLPTATLPAGDDRDLLAFLAVHQGRATPRSRLAAALWPDDPDAAARLSAAHERLDTFLVDLVGSGLSGDEAYDLEPGLIASDLGTFTTHAERGLAAHRDGRHHDAEAILLIAEAAYGGPLLDGEPARAWVEIARDDAAEAYLQVVMALVDLAEQRRDHHGAVRLLLRVVERDPYDEGAHLRLVSALERAGRRGESRRRYRSYTARMHEIGIEPAPFPDITPFAPAP